MALAVDAISNSNLTGSASSRTWSHTCTGSNLVLVVELYHANGDCVTGVTYNGVSMTQASKSVNSGDMTCYIYYLINPATGANNIIASASISNSFAGGAVSFTGASQTVPIGVTGGTTASLSQSVTSTVANGYLVASATSNGGALGTEGAGQTRIFKSAISDMGGSSYKATTTVGSYTMSYDGGGGTVRAITVAEILPFVASSRRSLSLLGVS